MAKRISPYSAGVRGASRASRAQARRGREREMTDMEEIMEAIAYAWQHDDGIAAAAEALEAAIREAEGVK